MHQQFPNYSKAESWGHSSHQHQYVPRPAPVSGVLSNSLLSGIHLAGDDEKIYEWIVELMHGNSREQALLELSKKREQYNDLALILWHSFGVMTTLLQEIISVYPLLSPANLTAHASNRVCNALALLQCVASHTETRALFLNGTL